MNNMILIRGDKIAFPRAPGSFGDESNNCHDLKDLMTPMGWFIPCHESGMQAFYALDREQIYKVRSPVHVRHGVTSGPKGVLCTKETDGIQFHQVRFTDNNLTGLSPIRTGTDGFAIIGMYAHLRDMMTMAVRLTSTIEDAVDMYCRHTPSNRNMVEIWDKQQVQQFMKENYKPYLENYIAKRDRTKDKK
jgi:hypothetical protein